MNSHPPHLARLHFTGVRKVWLLVLFFSFSLAQSLQHDLSLGLQLYQLGQYAQALPLFQKATQEDPQNYEAFYLLGQDELALGLLTAAKSTFTVALRLNPTFPSTYVALAQVDAALYRSGGDPLKGELDQALLILHQGEQVAPHYAPLYLWEGVILSLQNHPHQALQVLQHSLKLTPTAAAASAIGDVELRLGNLEAATAAYRQATQLDPKDPHLQVRLGTLLLLGGHLHQAIAELNQAIVLSPGDAEAWARLGDAYYALKNWKQAGLCYAQTVALSPLDYPDAYYHLGRIELLHHPHKARFDLTKAVVLDPHNPDYRYWLGQADQALGDLAGAKAQYQEALKLDPHYLPAQQALSSLGGG
jgi:tetratricopeptide (TPR) repeat protein